MIKLLSKLLRKAEEEELGPEQKLAQKFKTYLMKNGYIPLFDHPRENLSETYEKARTS
jgi:CRISPR/Cas system-associated protein endoribonuclease Cas2